MNTRIATIAYLGLILSLFVADRDPQSRLSPARWLPLLWLAICGSRMVSLWFGGNTASGSPDQYLEGSPVDRALLGLLVAAGLGVLIPRREKVIAILRANWPILLFLLYGAVSILWSDFPGVALKRWVKALGALTMVLIVLTESNPLAAVRSWLARVGFLLVPLSVLLIKYYPDLGRGYNRFTWSAYYVGVATGKNELGIICLVFGVAAVWRLLQLYERGHLSRKKWGTLAQLVTLLMTFWLFAMANSVTSQSCFFMASVLMLSTHFRLVHRSRWMIHALVVLMLTVAVSALFLNFGSDLVRSMGRDPTLTGRTEVWKSVFQLAGNPWVGTGFESFWLGPRIEKLWEIHWWHPNEAHNGYIEVYLNLGWIGLLLFAFVLINTYRRVMSTLRRSPEEGRLRLAFLFTALAYNCTESATGAMHPVWIVFLLAAIVVPGGWARERTQTEQNERLPTLRTESVAFAEV